MMFLKSFLKGFFATLARMVLWVVMLANNFIGFACLALSIYGYCTHENSMGLWGIISFIICVAIGTIIKIARRALKNV